MEIVLKWWPLIVTGAAIIAWLIRLEAKVVMGNKIFELHKQNCAERIKHDYEESGKFSDRIEKSIASLFDLLRDVKGSVDEIRGWKDSVRIAKSD